MLIDSLGCRNIKYASETNLALKSHEISFAHNLFLSCQIVLKLCTEHGSDTAVLCAKYQNDLTTELGEWPFIKFKFKIEFQSDILYGHSSLGLFSI